MNGRGPHGTGLELAHDGGRPSPRDLDVAIPDGSLTVIVGSDACGKSTLLRALARMLAPRAGRSGSTAMGRARRQAAAAGRSMGGS